MTEKIREMNELKTMDEKRRYTKENLLLKAEKLPIRINISLGGSFGKSFEKEILFKEMIIVEDLLKELTEKFQHTFIEILYEKPDGGRSIPSIQFCDNFIKIEKKNVDLNSETLVEDYLKK